MLAFKKGSIEVISIKFLCRIVECHEYLLKKQKRRSGCKELKPARVSLPDFLVSPTSWRSAIMLVLSRKVGEKVVIGDNITVVISRVAGNRVTIGIEAPPDVRIMRGELDQERGGEATTAPALPVNARQPVIDTSGASVFRLAK